MDLRSPVTVDILRLLMDSTQHVTSSKYEAVLLRTMFALMFHGFMRIGEVTNSRNNIQFSHVKATSQAVTISFHNFKHHTGPPVLVTIPATNTRYCPVHATLGYISMRGFGQGPFFSYPGEQAVQANHFNTLLSGSLAWSNLSNKNIKPHSFRIGAATWAAGSGFSDIQIQAMGRWHSSAFKKYIRIQSFKISM